GKGKGDPSPSPTDAGKGKGTPSPSPSDAGKGKGTPSPSPSDAGKGKSNPSPSPTAKGATTLYVVASLPEAQRFAGFDVRTRAGWRGPELPQVRTATIAFDSAPGRPAVELTYALGQARVTIVEVQDPFDVPAAVRASGEAVPVGGSVYAL